MHVLITGAAGFNGETLTPLLLERGHHVSAVVRGNTGRLPQEVLNNQSFAEVPGDLSNGVSFPKGVEAVIHMAATSQGLGLGADIMARDNVMATRQLVRQSVEAGVSCFVYFSSLSVYGKVSHIEVDENTPIIDPDVYGTTKMVGEQLVAERAESWRSLAIRLPGVIGPRPVRHWMANVLAKVQRDEDIEVFNGEQPFNNAAHVKDVCAMVVGLLEKDWKGHDAITIGAADEISVRVAVETLIRAAGSSSEIVECQAPKSSFIISNKNAIDNYGYKPQGIVAMLQRFVAENS